MRSDLFEGTVRQIRRRDRCVLYILGAQLRFAQIKFPQSTTSGHINKRCFPTRATLGYGTTQRYGSGESLAGYHPVPDAI